MTEQTSNFTAGTSGCGIYLSQSILRKSEVHKYLSFHLRNSPIDTNLGGETSTPHLPRKCWSDGILYISKGETNGM